MTQALLTLNGVARFCVATPRRYCALKVTRDGAALVCAALDCALDIRRARDLLLLKTLDLSRHGVPLSLSFSPDDRHLLVATQDGKLVVCNDPASTLQQIDAALERTVLGLSSMGDYFA